MTTSPDAGRPYLTRARNVELFRRLKGKANRAEVGRRIGAAFGEEAKSRQYVLDMERGWGPCKGCKGTGVLQKDRFNAAGIKIRSKGDACTRCKGTGEMIWNPTLEQLERLGAAFGTPERPVHFEVMLIDDRTGQIVSGVAPAFRQN